MAVEIVCAPDPSKRHEHRSQRRWVTTDNIAMEWFKHMATRK